MTALPRRDYPPLREDQMLAIGAYGESVAAYRYTVLSERVPDPEDRQMFRDIAAEEQGHKARLEALAHKHYPDRTFYISDEDKALVLTGPRLIEVRDLEDYREVMQIALHTEIRVSQFYEEMSRRVSNPEIRTVFQELAEEGFDHHQRLYELARERGFLPE